MFGVAMTLLAATLTPRLSRPTKSALELLHDLSGQIYSVALSFASAGGYWIIQQRRLEMTHSVTPLQTLLHFGFLFLIVLLPISTGLYVNYDPAPGVVTLYGAHLSLLSFVNLLLWLEIRGRVVTHARIAVRTAMVGAVVAFALFVAGTAIGAERPEAGRWVWFSTFAVPLLIRLFPRMRSSAAGRSQ